MSIPNPESTPETPDVIELSHTLQQEVVEHFYTYEQVAHMTAISVTLVERFVSLNLIEPHQTQLRERDVARIAQMIRLRRDLGLNWVGAGMVLDLCQEVSQLKAQLKAYEEHCANSKN